MEAIPTAGKASEPIMRLVSNDELDRRKEMESVQQKPEIVGLAAYLRRLWEDAKREKDSVIGTSGQSIEDQMLEDYRQRNGQYSPAKLAEIRAYGGSEIYMQLTSVKCRAAEAWIGDVLLPDDEKPWGLDPTPIADLPPDKVAEAFQEVTYEVAQHEMLYGVLPSQELIRSRLKHIHEKMKKEVQEIARERANRMEEKIEDQLVEAKFKRTLKAVIKDIVTTKLGILKGPLLRRKKVLTWEQDDKGGYMPKVSSEIRIDFERVSPLDWYPLPGCKAVGDGGCIERIRYRPSSLEKMIGVEGWDEEAIQAVIEEYGNGGLVDWMEVDSERAEIEQRPVDTSRKTAGIIEGLEFTCEILGSYLKDYGMDVDATATYPVRATLIGNYVVKAVLNDDLLGRWDYHVASYEEVQGSIYGRGVPELMRDIQTMCNAVSRALANNVGIASGPQTVINDIDRIAPGEEGAGREEDSGMAVGGIGMQPWKVWQATSDSNATTHRPFMEFYTPPLIADKLMAIYEFFSGLADDHTGIPAYTYGDADVSGAGKTASGLSMLMGQASKGMKDVIRHIDDGIIVSVIERMFHYNMRYDPDNSIKGDLIPYAKGSAALFSREQQQIRRNEFLQSTNNPADLEILGREGRAKILREVAKTLHMDVDEIIPEDEPELLGAMQPQMTQPQTLDAAGNPVAGQDARLFNPTNPQG